MKEKERYRRCDNTLANFSDVDVSEGAPLIDKVKEIEVALFVREKKIEFVEEGEVSTVQREDQRRLLYFGGRRRENGAGCSSIIFGKVIE
jgi:hypothetical protein